MKRIINNREQNILKGNGMKAILAIAFLFSSLATFAQDGEALFKSTCAPCHTIGGGKTVGPDLKGVTEKRPAEWLVKWITSSQALVNSGDADAKAIFAEFNNMVMPDATISEAEVKSVVEYLKQSGSATATVQDTTPVVPKRSTDDATPEEIQMGMDLFQGSQMFSAGGPSCISCHHVSYNGVIPGGLLAKDLTEAYTRLGGDAGLQAMMASPAFPAMQVAFGDRKLTEQEIYCVTAFLNKVNKDTANRATAQGSPLLYGGGPAFVVLLIFIFLLWFNRKKATVKRTIYVRQIKSK